MAPDVIPPSSKQQQLVMWLLNIAVTLLTTIMMFFTASIWSDLNEMKKEVYTNSANITALLKDIERLEDKIDALNQKTFAKATTYNYEIR